MLMLMWEVPTTHARSFSSTPVPFLFFFFFYRGASEQGTWLTRKLVAADGPRTSENPARDFEASLACTLGASLICDRGEGAAPRQICARVANT